MVCGFDDTIVEYFLGGSKNVFSFPDPLPSGAIIVSPGSSSYTLSAMGEKGGEEARSAPFCV
jgi:hypothetical protein